MLQAENRIRSTRIEHSMKNALGLEQLEDRTLLAAQVLSSLFDFAELSVDPSSYDSTSILVRLHPDANCHASGCLGIAGGAAITGAEIGGAPLSFLQDLRKVDLSPAFDVESALAAFRADPNVLYAEPNYRLYMTADPDDARFGEMWGLNNVGQTGGRIDADIDAPAAWDVTTGSGSTVVAVIDTGVDYNHPDLAPNMWVNPGEIPGDNLDNDGNGFVDDVHGYDFFNGDGQPLDDQGHGTHVAGTIGAAGNNGIGVTGINWDIQIMALKFLGADGSGTTSDAIDAINYAVANGATISNNSWGGDPYSQAMFDAISAARDAGHIFVAASGNGDALGNGLNNDADLFYPASYDLDNIIATGAVDHNDNLASFSNYGATTVDLAAPGVNILSTTPGGSYGLSTGTSMAAPHVAGVTALVRDLHPTWSYDEVIAQILASVDPLPTLLGITVTGGRLNAAAAVGNPEPPPPPPPPGTLPILDDFSDGMAEFFDAEAGIWNPQLSDCCDESKRAYTPNDVTNGKTEAYTPP
jgi:subtilisin family serine protease